MARTEGERGNARSRAMSPGQGPVRLPDESWAPLEDAIQRFVTTWRQGPRPALDDYLAGAGPLRQALLVELVHTELELRLKEGELARVEEYLARYPELAGDRAAVVGLIAAEHAFRRRREPGLSLSEYL